jgi:hypothetical protein
MQKALATFRGGRIEFDSGVDWPEGTRVEVLPIQNSVGMNEADWPTRAEGIAELVKRINEREPLEMTDAEFAAWEAERRSEKERQKEFTRQSWTQAETLL